MAHFHTGQLKLQLILVLAEHPGLLLRHGNLGRFTGAFTRMFITCLPAFQEGCHEMTSHRRLGSDEYKAFCLSLECSCRLYTA